MRCQIPYEQHGICSRREDSESGRESDRGETSGIYVLLFRRCTYAGGNHFSYADGKDIGLVGFAGPRVIKQTIGQELPEGFQRSEFLVEHGIIDGIITRDKMKDTMYELIVTHKQRQGYANFDQTDSDEKFDISELLKERLKDDEPKTPWEKLRGARQMSRPSGFDYVKYICDDFREIHGDRTMNEPS